MIKLSTHWYDLETNSIHNDVSNIQEPRQCMHCKNTGTQVPLGCYGTLGKHDGHQGIALFSCQLCGSTSIHFLFVYNENHGADITHYISFKSIPSLETENLNFSNIIQKMFPSFCKIYIQSGKAENEELDQIAGMGYRKALEFLVTDYLIEYPVDGVSEDWLKNPNISLGNKISKLPNVKIQKLAKAISFIGNDETHYSRRHPEYDVDSIKIFIRILISEIENEIEYEKAVALINKPKS